MEYTSPNVKPSSGLLHRKISMAHFDLTRIEPDAALSDFVENYWIIRWDLMGKPDYHQSNLPHPSVNMVVDTNGRTGFFGIQTGRFDHCLTGAGKVFGIKFHPGAAHAFYKYPLSQLTDTQIAISDLFGGNDAERQERLLHLNDPMGMATDIETMLLAQAPVLTPQMQNARQLVDLIANEPEISSVAGLAKLSGKSARSLQRLFETCVGIGPKWVIDRYRMLAAVDALNAGQPLHLTDLAHTLGYFDQAHFSRTFQALTGLAPSAYAKRAADL